MKKARKSRRKQASFQRRKAELDKIRSSAGIQPEEEIKELRQSLERTINGNDRTKS